jgi:hypothetical protein
VQAQQAAVPAVDEDDLDAPAVDEAPGRVERRDEEDVLADLPTRAAAGDAGRVGVLVAHRAAVHVMRPGAVVGKTERRDVSVAHARPPGLQPLGVRRASAVLRFPLGR